MSYHPAEKPIFQDFPITNWPFTWVDHEISYHLTTIPWMTRYRHILPDDMASTLIERIVLHKKTVLLPAVRRPSGSLRKNSFRRLVMLLMSCHF